MIFYKTMKKNVFPTYPVLEKSVYHLITAISIELPIYIRLSVIFVRNLSYSFFQFCFLLSK